MMRVLIEFLLFMCCLASIFQLALVIRRYMAIKKDWLLCKTKVFSQSCVTGCYILAFFVLRFY
ncbi:hypothetical protein ACS47_00965 [Bacillus cereus]|uniref:Uncharacterized protein n=2 Tax=Bacillus cereus group TaxID=86661 RepID=A0A5M9GEH3_9BACI|nr:conserved hypothetical protein [Bacillus cereus AH187]AYY25076.1 hypothetical protein EGX95_00360 [Bacillus sp. FDAARGOS_527]KAA8472580.1 hypothetical protein FYW06_28615 [Bacillus paranthracis]KFK71165.1 putative membrane protein [Bacillus cereus]MBG9836874.1 hypothetical protein [Bacillus tropicus]MBJ8354325.1 hypothetical protein [Bacillus mycoides]OJE20664.1 hypothetical protein BAQ45_15780 [Bacillus pacificus]OXL92954.1 hypothetical protein B6N65_25320 [Bacillus sp. KbaB1]